MTRSTRRFTFFIVTFGVLSTLWGYTYGSGNQIEQLPIVLRAIDPSYLTGDFFVNAGAQYGPRWYFAILLALLSRFAALETVYFMLTVISNIAIAWVSARLAHQLAHNNELAGYLGAAFVLNLKTFWLGAENTLYRTYLEPSLLIMPLLLGGVWAALNRRAITVALLCAAAAFIHPLVGLETGAILFAILIIPDLYARIQKAPTISPPTISIQRLGTALLIFAAASAVILVPYLGEKSIGDEQFINILAYLRHPHHYLPSTFGLLQYIQAAAFLMASGIAAYATLWRTAQAQRWIAVLIAALLALLCLGGYLFVEIWPSRLWTTAQTFRLLYIIKWLGLLLLAVWVAQLWQSANTSTSRAEALILATSLLFAPAAALTALYLLVKPVLASLKAAALQPLQRGTQYGEQSNMASWIPLLFLAAFAITGALYSAEDHALLYGLALLAAFGLALPRRWPLAAVSITGSLILGAVLLTAKPPYLPTPIFTLDDQQGDRLDVAAYTRANIPTDALFLVPPKLGEFRLTARRAIVVDFKAFPFQDWAMAEWEQRLYDCCGMPGVNGWDAEIAMTLEYQRINDERLGFLHKRYGFTHIVLFRETPTVLPVLFEGETYKIVKYERD